MLLTPNQPVQQAIQVATPLNDVQLVALVAAGIYADCGGHVAAVDSAMAIVAETAARLPELPALIRDKARERAA